MKPDFAILGRRRKPCCDRPVALTADDRAHIAEVVEDGAVAQLLRRCPSPCRRTWRLLFEPAAIADRMGADVLRLTWEDADRVEQ